MKTFTLSAGLAVQAFALSVFPRPLSSSQEPCVSFLAVVGPPRASRRSLSLRRTTSLLPHWSFPVRKKVFFVRYEVQRFPAQKWYASKDEIDWSTEDSKIAHWIERLTALGVSGIRWPSSLLPQLLPIEKNLFPNIFHDAASVSEHCASARTSGQFVSFCSVLAGAGTPCNLIAFKRSVCFPQCQLHHSLWAPYRRAVALYLCFTRFDWLLLIFFMLSMHLWNYKIKIGHRLYIVWIYSIDGWWQTPLCCQLCISGWWR